MRESDAMRTVGASGGKSASRVPPASATAASTAAVTPAARSARGERAPSSQTRLAAAATQPIRKVRPHSPVTARSWSSGRLPYNEYPAAPQLP